MGLIGRNGEGEFGETGKERLAGGWNIFFFSPPDFERFFLKCPRV